MKRKLQLFDLDARGGRGDGGKMQRTKACELCSAVAAVYCAADSAFLCSGCDAAVHGANFLVARHVRLCRCVTCGSLLCISGPESDPRTRTCGTCKVSRAQPCSSSQSNASSCVSTAESKKRRVENVPTPTRGARARKMKPGRFARARATEVESVRRIARARKRVARDEEEGWAESD